MMTPNLPEGVLKGVAAAEYKPQQRKVLLAPAPTVSEWDPRPANRAKVTPVRLDEREGRLLAFLMEQVKLQVPEDEAWRRSRVALSPVTTGRDVAIAVAELVAGGVPSNVPVAKLLEQLVSPARARAGNTRKAQSKKPRKVKGKRGKKSR